MPVPEPLVALDNELANDPVSLGYATIRNNGGLSTRQKAEQLTALINDPTKRTRDRGVVSRTMVLKRMSTSEYNTAITDSTNGTRNQHYLLLALTDEIDVNDANIASIFTTIFGGSSQTVRNFTGHATLADDPWKGDDIRVVKISRAVELGIVATVADVEFCEAN